MKSVQNFFVIAIAAAFFSGCYTEVATVERTDDDYAYDSDTTYENGNATINNHYYLDDDYRRSRLRVSFNYYYPSYSPWISTYYYSYFNDPYWGWGRSYGYYDPYRYGCVYPGVYDPWYPYPGYYPPIVYYPVYYPAPGYGYTPPPNPGKIRGGGSTRDSNPNDRSRPIPSTPPATGLPVTDNVPERGRRDRIGTPTEAIPVKSPDRKRDPEIPWWEKMNKDRPTRIADSDSRTVDSEKGNKSPSIPSRKNLQRDDRSTYSPPKNNHPNESTRPVERSKRDRPTYTPPPKQSVPKDDAKPVERRRESRQPSYNPPPQSSPPASSSPRSSSGGSSSSGGNGRKRD